MEYIIGTGGAPLGNVESGTVASLTTPTISAVSGGIGCFVVAALIAFTIPALTHYRAGAAPDPLPAEPATPDLRAGAAAGPLPAEPATPDLRAEAAAGPLPAEPATPDSRRARARSSSPLGRPPPRFPPSTTPRRRTS